MFQTQLFHRADKPSVPRPAHEHSHGHSHVPEFPEGSEGHIHSWRHGRR